jgi:hypothetical protein
MRPLYVLRDLRATGIVLGLNEIEIEQHFSTKRTWGMLNIT